MPDWTGVYLMQDGDLYKIGYSSGVKHRLSNVRSRYRNTELHSFIPLPLGWLQIVEWELHKEFKGKEAWERSWEWFRLTEEDVTTAQAGMMYFAALANGEISTFG